MEVICRLILKILVIMVLHIALVFDSTKLDVTKRNV